ncbi:MAG: UDP-N-acetylmuramoyl-L-alanyl-D-glutamate--2,6-diaminopimelate ligase [Burkholderiales bacterium]|nr:UDP-N-acetylmuramoyl-L-alanyl-D-glutamate--2,6-diaminopimelate ligase [Burkholderiales bacterium]OUT76611.1 MAG: UDP-N-acetylmuramoyl-L-alanyl-D-glutamate--2,6-diaminopimelate ligase [Betaproteobacteria bacterium TMED22]|tara:strand:- start:55431 stop:56990 length:1560 start_codon:yes stop_codon:yes gene_type:complete
MTASAIERFFQSGLSGANINNGNNLKQKLSELKVAPTGLSNDSRFTKKGDIFFAYPGSNQDGRTHISEAIEKGCSVVIWERDGWVWNANHQLPNMGFNNVRALMGEFAALFYGDPTNGMHVLGVTGTNGKTTCVNWLAEAFFLLGRDSACIGTLGLNIPGKKIDVSHCDTRTTPDALALQRTFKDLTESGVSCVSIEVSSHALTQNRLNGTRVNVAIFTNLSHDHLDYHGTFELYGLAKAQLFLFDTLSYAVINIDDNFGTDLAASLKRKDKRVITYSTAKKNADIHVSQLALSIDGSKFSVVTPWGSKEIKSHIFGEFNVSNMLAVLGGLLCSGVDFLKACDAIGDLRHSEGRLQRVGEKYNRRVYIDYAHTPAALSLVLSTLKSLLSSNGRVITVFGAGGDRDKDKRVLMGRAVLEFSHIAIVTTDNPRYETPEKIIEQVTGGNESQFLVELDRRSAIFRAIELANKNDIICIAGKGHEKYQDVCGERIPFDDYAVAEEYLKKLHPDSNGHQDCTHV